MRRMIPLLLLLLPTACQEPSKQGQYDQIVTSLQYLHSWDPAREAEGQFAYDAALGSDQQILYSLAAHIANETPTAIYDRIAGRTVVVGDVCFLLLLKRTGRKWTEFSDDGVFVSSQLPNPVFCIRWDPGARARVRAHFMRILPPPDEFDK